LGQQSDNLNEIKKKAMKLGAIKSYVLDVKDEFADRYLAKLIKANGTYQDDYYISTISRYLMAKKAVEIALKESVDCIAHGCTGKGNDQVRIEATALAIKPDIKIIAPVREWSMGRDEQIAYADKQGIEVIQKHDFPYSNDDNMWGLTWEGGEIEDSNSIPKIEKFLKVNKIEDTPDEPEIIELEFFQGVPVKLNKQNYKLSNLITKLNEIGSNHGIGVKYMVEDRLVGLKIRGVYEHPGAEIVMKAHKKLELFVCTKAENDFKQIVDSKWSDLCYCAKWMDPLMNDLNSFINKLNERVTGVVTLKLHKGQAYVVALDSPYAVYDKKLATFNHDYSYNQNCSPGFIETYSLQMKTARQINKKEKTPATTPKGDKVEALG
jgi:argininosuccinate synthase